MIDRSADVGISGSRAWDWGSAGTAASMVGVPLLLVLLLGGTGTDLLWVVAVNLLVCALVVLVGAVLLRLRADLTDRRTTAWLAVALAAMAVHGAGTAVLRLARWDLGALTPEWALLVHVVSILTLVALVQAARHRTLHLEPLVLGVVTGAALVTLRYVGAEAFGATVAPPLPMPVLWLALAGSLVLLVRSLLAVRTWPPFLGGGVALGAVLTVAGRATTHAPIAGDGWLLFQLGCTAAGAVVICTVALSLLRSSIHEQRRDLTRLHSRLETLESGLRTERARLHDLGAGLAGLASASRLTSERTGLPQTARSRLQSMMAVELERLNRLVEPPAADPVRVVEMDEVLDHVCAVQEGRGGMELTWTPSGLWAYGRFDDLVEAVTTLLVNAAQHGEATQASIDVALTDDVVEIRVTDSGTGVPLSMRDQLFSWGASGTGAPGRGIGLHEARRLIAASGGSLRFDPHQTRGACFVIELPAATAQQVAA